MHPTFLTVLILRRKEPQKVANWYKEVLGVPLEDRDHGFSFMLGHTHFAIHGLEDGQSPTHGAEFGIYVPNVDEFVRELQAKKFELSDPVRDYPWARAAQLKDPLGNVIYLMELPKSSIVEIGKLLAKQFTS